MPRFPSPNQLLVALLFGSDLWEGFTAIQAREVWGSGVWG